MALALVNTACILSLLCAFSKATCILKNITTTPLITEDCSPFGPGIEGAGVDPQGNTYAVNFGSPKDRNTIGRITDSSLFFKHSDGTSLLNSIVFMPGKRFALAADAANKRVLKLELHSGRVVNTTIYCGSPDMLQGVPNDLALSASGNLYLSGQNYQANGTDKDGEVWLCPADGSKPRKLATMGRTNGITLSPDDSELYVSEAFNSGGAVVENKVWSFRVSKDGKLGKRRLVIDFKKFDKTEAVDIDGMKTDTSGALYISRNGGGQVLKLNAWGKPVARITPSFQGVTNMEFGGPDGKTLFIVGKCGRDKGCVDTVQVNSPGRMWRLLQKQ
jgi:sugar lactone lactonase YvrE